MTSAKGEQKHILRGRGKAYLCPGITMMIGIKFVLSNLVTKLFSDAILRHLLTNTRVQLAQLRPLPDLISVFMEVFRGFHCPAPCGSPNFQGS